MKSLKVETILITGARAPIALEMARSFYKKGHRVVMADSQKWTIGRWSNAVTKYIQIPSPRYYQDAFVKKIQEIIQQEKVTHLIPTCEEAFYFSMHKNEFQCKVWCSEIELMNELHNKFLFTSIGKNYFEIPETILVSEFKDWNHSADYVFKPIYSRFATSILINKTISETYFSLETKKKWIAQKRIQGKEICFYSIWDNGKLKAFSSYHPLYRAGKGSGIFFENFQNKKAFEAIKIFGEKIKYTGQLCFDAIVDENNLAHFLECNPRGTSGAHLINSRIADAYLLENKLELQDENEFSIKYALALLKPFSLFKRRVRKSKDVIFSWADSLPFLLQIISLLEITFSKLKNNKTWLEATTGDIEWNGIHEEENSR